MLTHPGDISLTAAAVGLAGLALMTALSRTRLTAIASLIALLIPTVLSLGASHLVRVEDSGPIPTGIPSPHLPHLSLLTSLHLIAGVAGAASADAARLLQPLALRNLTPAGRALAQDARRGNRSPPA